MESRTRFFDTRADHWEETCYPEPVRARLQDLIQEFGVRPGERLLDVGTGPGVLIPYLRSLVGASGRVIAFDLSFEMTRQAYQKKLGPRDMILRADVHTLPFYSGAFDRVVCFAAFPHFHDSARAMAEMARVLKPGGSLVVAHLMSREELAEHHGSCESVARDLLPRAEEMAALFSKSRLSLPEIVDRPGRYLATGLKI